MASELRQTDVAFCTGFTAGVILTASIIAPTVYFVTRSEIRTEAVKHGAARSILSPEVFDQCFEVIKKDVLETGRPSKKLLLSDASWQRRKSLSVAPPGTPTASNGGVPFTDTEEGTGGREAPMFEKEVTE